MMKMTIITALSCRCIAMMVTTAMIITNIMITALHYCSAPPDTTLPPAANVAPPAVDLAVTVMMMVITAMIITNIMIMALTPKNKQQQQQQ